MKLGTRACWLPAKSRAELALEPSADSNTTLPQPERGTVTLTTVPTAPDEGSTDRLGDAEDVAADAAGARGVKTSEGRNTASTTRRNLATDRSSDRKPTSHLRVSSVSKSPGRFASALAPSGSQAS
ncbi:MAG: hypothetical protein ACYC1D_05890 [Acidimicrobiales bacterium]